MPADGKSLSSLFLSRRCLSITLLRDWLSQSNIALFHLALFGRVFFILMNLWGNFREILLFPSFVLFCWRLLLPIYLFRRVAFREGMFTLASTAIKNLPMEEQFSPDAIRHCHEARNIPCFNVLIEKGDMMPQVAINLVTESGPMTFFTTLNCTKYKTSSSSWMSGVDCTVTRSCLAAPFARSLYF